MSRAAFGAAFAAALALGLWLRLADPAARPMHHDEANQAVRFGLLLETGEYRYDPHDHHGPTLYYATLPFAWARGQRTLAALDERTLRMVPAAFGAGVIALFLFLAGPRRAGLYARPIAPPDNPSPGVDRAAVIVAAALAAVSPVLTYYSRAYIQESLFLFFALAFLIALGRYAQRPAMTPAIVAGAMAGLAFATKETSLIVLPAAVAACALAARLAGVAGPPARVAVRHGVASAAAALLPVVFLYSAFFSYPAGILGAFTAIPVYLSRGMDPGAHGQPFLYYVRVLAWSSSGGLLWTEALILGLAGIGAVSALVTRTRAFWPVYICLYSLGTLAVFSAVRYKTPWNVLPFYAGLVLLAGIGGAALFTRLRYRGAQAVLAAALAAAGWQLAGQSVRASFRYAADPRNPYAYAHTSPDFLRLAARVRDLAAHHPDGPDLLVKVVAGPHEQWPFPWYARGFTHVGYWTTAAGAAPLDDAAVIVASQAHAATVEAALGERYLAEYYGLRPGELLTLYVERGLWDRFLDSRR
jgi:predicted membrane-bound mannosyltransferase